MGFARPEASLTKCRRSLLVAHDAFLERRFARVLGAEAFRCGSPAVGLFSRPDRTTWELRATEGSTSVSSRSAVDGCKPRGTPIKEGKPCLRCCSLRPCTSK